MEATFEDQALEAVVCSGQGIGEGLKELVIVPWGTVKSKKGDFIMDDAAASAMIEAFDKHGVSLPCDWEHESLKAKGRADAAGWIEKLYAAPGIGLKALVRWTKEARDAIRGDKYRYLSPTLWINKDDRRASQLHSAALTNQPAIPAMERVAASNRNPRKLEYVTMSDEPKEAKEGSAQATKEGMEVEALKKKIRELLQIDEQATSMDVLKAAVEKLEALMKDDGSDGDESIANSVRELLQLPADAGKSAVVLAMKTRDTSGATEELVSMREAESVRVAEAHVARFVKDLKIDARDAVTMSAALDLAKTNPDLLDQLMANAASVMPPQGRTNPPPLGPEGRARTILKASNEYRGNAELQKCCTGKAHVNLALHDHGMEPLTDDESREFVTL